MYPLGLKTNFYVKWSRANYSIAEIIGDIIVGDLGIIIDLDKIPTRTLPLSNKLLKWVLKWIKHRNWNFGNSPNKWSSKVNTAIIYWIFVT